MTHFQKHNNEQLNEGVISYATDLIMAFRFVRILFQDFKKTKAFELGIIDENGKRLKVPTNLEERSAYSPFIRLAFRIKHIINAVPGGQTKFGSMAAAFLLLKENEDIDFSQFSLEDLDSLFEDAPVVTVSAVASTSEPIGKPLRRKWNEMDKFAGGHVFEVESITFNKCKSAKQKYERWDKYIGDEDGDVGQDILKFSKTYPDRGILLKEKGTNALVFLKNRKTS